MLFRRISLELTNTKPVETDATVTVQSTMLIDSCKPSILLRKLEEFLNPVMVTL